jgi:hypothetical protein
MLIPPKNTFRFSYETLSVKKNSPFHYPHSFSEHEEAGRLEPIVGVEYKAENTPERLFGHRCERTHLFTFVPLAKVATADCGFKTAAVT